MIALGVRHRAVQAAGAVDLGVDEEAAAEDAVAAGGGGIDPLVQVAVQIVDAVSADALAEGPPPAATVLGLFTQQGSFMFLLVNTPPPEPKQSLTGLVARPSLQAPLW